MRFLEEYSWSYNLPHLINIKTRLDYPVLNKISGFSLFMCEQTQEQAILNFNTYSDIEIPDGVNSLYEFEFEDIKCVFSKLSNSYYFVMSPPNSCDFKMEFIESDINKTYIANTNWELNPQASLLRFGLWMAYNLAAVNFSSIAVHTSTIVYKGKAIMFLGESGTGKSTHSRLWLKNIEGCQLLNDDSPILSIINNEPYVFGSPWSGKTPCYKKENYPLHAIVRLSQAPYNKASKLSTIRALGALLPSCPPALACSKELEDKILDIISKTISKVDVFHLQCLANNDAVYEIKKYLNI